MLAVLRRPMTRESPANLTRNEIAIFHGIVDLPQSEHILRSNPDIPSTK